VLDQPFADAFSRVAKLRNVLVHLYDTVDIGFLFSLVPALIKDTKSFLRQLTKSLAEGRGWVFWPISLCSINPLATLLE
jgi:uncharacterized protein YutE (UPF0331/DUF86 family)